MPDLVITAIRRDAYPPNYRDHGISLITEDPGGDGRL
jgi:hypothetical protein